MDRNIDMKNLNAMNLFRTIGIKVQSKGHERMKELGINPQQGAILRYIHTHKNEKIIQQDIAEAFFRKRATITSILQGLEKKGYIERKISENNAREKNIYLLEKGEKIIEDAEKILRDLEIEFSSILNEEESKTLNKLLNKINDAL